MNGDALNSNSAISRSNTIRNRQISANIFSGAIAIRRSSFQGSRIPLTDQNWEVCISAMPVTHLAGLNKTFGQSELDIYPLHDINLTYIATYTPHPIFTIGAGVDLLE